MRQCVRMLGNGQRCKNTRAINNVYCADHPLLLRKDGLQPENQTDVPERALLVLISFALGFLAHSWLLPFLSR